MAKRITQKEILGHFLETFCPDKVLTSSEYKMQAFKLKNLKKVVKTYIEDAKIETDKSTEEIIMDAITYGGIMKFKFNSIASIGYDVLPKSIEYWKRMKLLEEKKKEEEQKKEKEESLATLEEMRAIENNKRLQQVKKIPKWMTDDD